LQFTRNFAHRDIIKNVCDTSDVKVHIARPLCVEESVSETRNDIIVMLDTLPIAKVQWPPA
jgi:hypothetical protein